MQNTVFFIIYSSTSTNRSTCRWLIFSFLILYCLATFYGVFAANLKFNDTHTNTNNNIKLLSCFRGLWSENHTLFQVLRVLGSRSTRMQKGNKFRARANTYTNTHTHSLCARNTKYSTLKRATNREQRKEQNEMAITTICEEVDLFCAAKKEHTNK